ncbi:hypothetical protein ACFZC5_22375 [Nocardia gamkensis]|uniref:hypothetical protein n=1 Tax=Nocardia gamkensis TaxID=352869 RepID=UPI0036E2CB40
MHPDARGVQFEYRVVGVDPADAAAAGEDTWALVRKHFDDEQIATLVYLVAMINAANRLGVITRTKGGSYQAGAFETVAN